MGGSLLGSILARSTMALERRSQLAMLGGPETASAEGCDTESFPLPADARANISSTNPIIPMTVITATLPAFTARRRPGGTDFTGPGFTVAIGTGPAD